METPIQQKICVISFDHWNYDKHIVKALNDYGIESFHIKIGNFKYKNTWERIQNSLSKIFLGKNPKLKKRQDYIDAEAKKQNTQDDLGNAISNSIIELAKTKKYTVDKK